MVTNLDARLAGYHSPVLSVFRIIFGLLYMMHGSQKLFDWPIAAPAPVETGSFPLWWAGLIELVLGILITIGLFTRIAAFVASGEMAFAYFYQHWPILKGNATAPFWPIANGGELVSEEWEEDVADACPWRMPESRSPAYLSYAQRQTWGRGRRCSSTAVRRQARVPTPTAPSRST